MGEACQSEAFCLHVRPYRETSAIVQLFTREYGKISLVAKGAKRPGRGRQGASAILQPFLSLSVHWQGRGELKTLTGVEVQRPVSPLKEKSLLAGLYLNELLSAVLPEQFEYAPLYDEYQAALLGLGEADNIERVLRCFEKQLLEALGYGIAFVEVNTTGDYCGMLSADKNYRYVPDSGFIESKEKTESCFTGSSLLDIAAEKFEHQDVLLAAKRLMRVSIGQLLGDRAINSRHLFL